MKPTYITITAILAIITIYFIFGGASSGAGNQKEVIINTINTKKIMDTQITELKIEDEVVGTGEVAESGDTVTMNYVGMLTDGTVFDASAKHGDAGFPFVLGVGQVIKGWDQGIVGMKVGGKRRLLIPHLMAYGPQAIGNIIPAYSDLVFDVELLKVQKK